MLLWPHEEVPVDALAQALGIHTQNHSLWQARLHVLLVETSQAHPTCKITHVYVCQRCVCVSILFALVDSMQIQLIEIESCDHQKWKSMVQFENHW